MSIKERKSSMEVMNMILPMMAMLTHVGRVVLITAVTKPIAWKWPDPQSKNGEKYHHRKTSKN
ncbi:hypothetical protein OH492_12835 [Vibrio chagasii]|nr:hypothetical protein [Vibrio chagasii]